VIPSLLADQEFTLSKGDLRRLVRLPTRQVSSGICVAADAEPSLATWWQEFLRGVRPVAIQKSGRHLRVVDLFCGVGGLALGVRQAADELGHTLETVLAVDRDVQALSVYQKNHASRLTSTDSTDALVAFQMIGSGDSAKMFSKPHLARSLQHLKGTIDVVLAGPPCQGHSNLNNHSRRTDERNSLYLTVTAMAIALRAPMVVIENVPAVVHDHHNVVSSTVSLLKEAGYYVEYGVLNAATMGWPQTRKRYFVVASREQHPIALTEVQRALTTDTPLSVWWAIEDLIAREMAGFMDRLPALSEENQRRVEFLAANNVYELPNDQRPACHRGGTTYSAVYGRMRQDQPAPTITGGFLSPGRGRFTHPTEPRVLTPREAARIQAFPDHFDFVPAGVEEPKQTHLARWIGNAVPMPLGYAAGLSVLP
jgi:DNA (cytosine-5)-methyltransferase 1